MNRDSVSGSVQVFIRRNWETIRPTLLVAIFRMKSVGPASSTKSNSVFVSTMLTWLRRWIPRSSPR